MKSNIKLLKSFRLIIVAFVLLFGLFGFASCEKLPTKKSAEELFELMSPSVCTIRSDYSAGSGFIFDTGGNAIYILTNKHVLENDKQTVISDSVRVEFLNGKKFEATLLGYHTYHDIALLRVESDKAKDYKKLELATKVPSVGTRIYGIGNALELGLSMSEGMVSVRDQTLSLENKRVPVTQVTAPINAGCSGGPIFDEYGFVVGIGTYQIPKNEERLVDGVSFYVDVSIAEKIARQIMYENPQGKKDAAECYILGLELAKVQSLSKFELEFTSLNFSATFYNSTLMVTSVSNLATDGGVQLSVGDSITRIGSLSIDMASLTDIFVELYSFTDTRVNPDTKADNKLTIAFESNGIKKELTVLNKNEKNY